MITLIFCHIPTDLFTGMFFDGIYVYVSMYVCMYVYQTVSSQV
jgi:hypothetical protein